MADERHHDADDVNARLIDTLLSDGSLRSPHVEAAFRSILRHHFLPDTPLEEVYSARAVVTRRGPDGMPTSSASDPKIMARMLEQLDVRPGHRVLEIGAATGYNAALLSHLSGEAGTVTTVDIDPILTATAVENLRRAGVEGVDVVTGDGWAGAAPYAPFDRIEATVGVWDVPRVDGSTLRRRCVGGPALAPSRPSGIRRLPEDRRRPPQPQHRTLRLHAPEGARRGSRELHPGRTVDGASGQPPTRRRRHAQPAPGATRPYTRCARTGRWVVHRDSALRPRRRHARQLGGEGDALRGIRSGGRKPGRDRERLSGNRATGPGRSTPTERRGHSAGSPSSSRRRRRSASTPWRSRSCPPWLVTTQACWRASSVPTPSFSSAGSTAHRHAPRQSSGSTRGDRVPDGPASG